MKLIVNGNEKFIEVSSLATLDEIVADIEKDLEGKQLITDITINEKKLRNDWADKAKHIYLLEDDTVIVTTRNVKEIAFEALSVVAEQKKNISLDLQDIADSFRMEEDTVANQKFIKGIENLQFFFRIIEDALKLLQKNLSSTYSNGKSIEVLLREFSSLLQEVIDIQNRKDWVLLADFIEYEIKPKLDEFDDFFKTINI